MADRTFPVRDPNAMLLHPDYHAKTGEGQDPFRILPKNCIREGHGERVMGHLVSRAVLRLIADPDGEVTVLGTGYKEMEDGEDYLSAAGTWPFHLNSATAFPGTCKLCEPNFASADNVADPRKGVDLRRALFEACARNTHHVVWLMDFFNNTLRAYESVQEDHPIKNMSSIDDLQSANERIAELAREYLPPLLDDPIPAGTPLERDGHFRHFTRVYPDTEFKVAVSTEVVLQHNHDSATQTLAFINVMPQKADSEAGWHTAAALSMPRTAPSVWDAILDNSAHSGNFGELAHQLLISNLATRSPDGVCFAPAHFGALSRETGIWEAGILPNLLANPLPGLCLPVVNVIGRDLSSLANCSFNIFA